MKKSTIFVLLLLAAMLLGVTVAASAESKDDYWASINAALNKLEAAIGTKGDVNGAMAELRSAVYAGSAYLVKAGIYDSRVNEIVRYADLATRSADYKYLLAQAHYFNDATFGTEVTGHEVPVFHS